MWEKSIKRIFRGVALVALLGIPSASFTPHSLFAQDLSESPAGFDAYRAQLRAAGEAAGIKAETLDAVIPNLKFLPRVVALDRSQPGSSASGSIPAFAPYRARHVDAARIDRGRARYARLRPLLERVEKETGVPEAMMMAIYGHETNYGAYTGSFDLANALASLAYDGRRRALFTQEFVALLKLMDQGIPRARLKGSWAGATGYPQFLPSVYLRVARDGDGDNIADIWRSEADALASIANYFRNAGWRAGVPWGVSAQLSAGFQGRQLATRLVSPRCPRVHGRHSQWKTVAEWRALGVVPSRAILRDTELVSLFQPDGPNSPAWLLTGNYRVILDYNCSNFYALSVGLLADAVEVGVDQGANAATSGGALPDGLGAERMRPF